jgi:hypothetical protein
MGVLLGFVTFFAMMFGIFYMFYTTRNRERIALIEKGAEASVFEMSKSSGNFGTAIGSFFNALKIGLFLIGIGLGIVVGYLLTYSGMEEGAAYTSMIFLFGGLGLVVYYLLNRKK